jgi:glycosyltransferase involved in cell wall biosynthesis
MGLQFSVVICTYQRVDLLTSALDSLGGQKLAPDRFEVLVVDNGMSESAGEAVQERQKLFPGHTFRYIAEPKIGLAAARNTGIVAAVGDWIGFLDDDARADPSWLEMAAIKLASQEEIVCVGGPIRPFFTQNKPAWFKDDYETRTWGNEARALLPGESFSGSNMIWRKETLLELGRFNEGLGMRGQQMALGEETQLFRRSWTDLARPVMIYNPDMIVYHWTPDYKMRVGYFWKRQLIAGQTAFLMDDPGSIEGRTLFLLRSLAAFGWRSLLAILRIRQYPAWQNWAVEEAGGAVGKLGAALAAAGISIRVKAN